MPENDEQQLINAIVLKCEIMLRCFSYEYFVHSIEL